MINRKLVESEDFKRKLQEDEDFKKVYLEYLTNPNEMNKIHLDEMYKRYERQLIGLKYLRQMIFFECKRFDAKIRKRNLAHLSLDAPYDENLTFMDLLEDENAENNLNVAFEKELKEVFSDERLCREILSMTDKQKEVLHGLYVSELPEAVLAQQLGVTQQAVSKRHRGIMNKLRKGVSVGC